MKNNDFNFINKDIIQLDTRVKHEYDIERALKHEYDNEEFSCHSGLRAGIQRDDNLMQKTFRFAQSGRSMVEMLGVLAVIGVLSIGGIMGYNYGMDKYRANETINELTVRAMSLINYVGVKWHTEDLPMEMGYETDLGYSVDAWISPHEDKHLVIALADIPTDVCRQILNAKWTLPTKIYGDNEDERNDVFSSPSVCGPGELTDMYFEFSPNFSIKGTGDGEGLVTLPFW